MDLRCDPRGSARATLLVLLFAPERLLLAGLVTELVTGLVTGLLLLLLGTMTAAADTGDGDGAKTNAESVGEVNTGIGVSIGIGGSMGVRTPETTVHELLSIEAVTVGYSTTGEVAVGVLSQGRRL